MPLPAGADGRMVGTPEGGMPPVEGSMAELLANLERTALEKQTAESGAHTFTGRVFGRDDKPWAGYEFICSGGRRGGPLYDRFGEADRLLPCRRGDGSESKISR